jgi:formate hydrogenlyase subunit 4
MSLPRPPGDLLAAVFQGIVLFLLAPAMLGLLRFVKARLVGRRRHPITILHPYFDLLELVKLPAARPTLASTIFYAAPLLLLLAYGSLAFMIPAFVSQPLLAVDLVFIIYLLGLARFIFSLAGMDIASPFSSMGSGREMFYQFNAEIGFATFVAALAVQTGSVSLPDLIGLQAGYLTYNNIPILILLGLTLAVVLIIETGRLPVDNQETHYELTAGHKNTGWEYAGRDVALIEYAHMVKLVCLAALFIALFSPFTFPALAAWAGIPRLAFLALYFVARLTLLTAVLALYEISQVKIRIRAVPAFALWSIVFGFFAVLYTMGSR